MRTYFFSCKSLIANPRTIADLPLNGSHEPINNISLIISKLFIHRFKIIFFSELNKYLFMSFNQIKK